MVNVTVEFRPKYPQRNWDTYKVSAVLKYAFLKMKVSPILLFFQEASRMCFPIATLQELALTGSGLFITHEQQRTRKLIKMNRVTILITGCKFPTGCAGISFYIRVDSAS
jgi:hypothetical protein